MKMGVIAVQGDCRLAILQLDLLKAFHNHILLDSFVHHLHSWCSHLRSLVALAFLAVYAVQGILIGVIANALH